MTPTDESSAAPSPALILTARSIALAHMGLLAASGLTQMIASVHATIARRPTFWRGEAAAAEQAPSAYRLIARSFLWLAALARQLSRELPAQEDNSLFRSALNGAVGNSLQDFDNPLSQGMSLRNEFGDEISALDWQREVRRGLVLFVHGLCLSEREWQSHAHQGFVRELREFGYGVAWLRYNTGRAIVENGAALSQLLEDLPSHKMPITLIGHSMGGLVIRAASHHAAHNELHWLHQLNHAAYLGSPHQGAPLERFGEGANRLLALTPYTRPFMQLGNLRSVGIQDLRHGRIVSAEQESPCTLNEKTRHLLIAGHLGRGQSRHWLGDGLVPVRSALGQHLEPEKALQGRDVTRLEFSALGHMAMLKDERVYAALMEWMKP